MAPFTKTCLVSLISVAPLSAISVRLYNDSSHFLRAQVIGADGTLLGETALAPQTWNAWNDDAYSDTSQNAELSQTPLIVHWYCAKGEDYSVCTNVSSGATVTAQTCSGNCQCPTKPLKKGEQMPLPQGGDFSSPPEFPTPKQTSQEVAAPQEAGSSS